MDEGAIRFRMPDEGTVSWDDAVRGRIEFANENLADPIIVRSDGRAIYNFASPVDDMLDGITHVIRGEDHVSNTPTQIHLLRALGAELPVYAHVPNIFGTTARSSRSATARWRSRRSARTATCRAALMNFLALLGWSYDDKTTIMSPAELVERFSLDRVVPSAATFDYEKLDWMNGVYLRALPEDEYAAALARAGSASRGSTGRRRRCARRAARAGEDREALGSTPTASRFLFEPVSPDGAEPEMCRAAAEALAALEPWDAAAIEETLRALAERARARSRGRRSRRSASRSRARRSRPALFESLELLGRDESLARLRAAGPSAGTRARS